MRWLEQADPEVAKAIRLETERQSRNLELIASENFVSEAVLEAVGSVMTNKYAEGYPGRRYYGGCENVDTVEELAVQRAKELFGAEHVNVQPHSGSQANMAAYFTVLSPGDTIVAPNLAHGGHLTMGNPINFSGKLYRIVPYGVRREDERIDIDQVRALCREHRPKLLVTGGSAFPRAIDFKPFREIADEVGCLLMADIAHPAGLVAAGLHPTPIPYADFVTSTTHKTLRGPRGGMVMCRSAHAQALDKVVMPGMQGGPLMHVIAAKAVAFREALTPDWRAYQRQIVAQREGAGRRAHAARAPARDRRARTPTSCWSTSRRPGSPARKPRRRSTGPGSPSTRTPSRSRRGVPMVTSGIRVGTPAVTTRGHEGARDGGHRGLHRPRAARARRPEGRGLGAGRRRLAGGPLPALPGAPRVKCPFCGHTEDRVVDSRVGRDGEFIRRRRECLKCNRRYTTYEYIEDILPMVVKRDGRREPFDRAKLRNSVLKACEKRSVGVQAVDDVVSDIESKLHERAEKEVSSRELGELVMARLQRLDQVAYVRFASVYRQFNDVTQFMDEVKGLIKKEPKEPEKAKRRKARG